MAAVRYHHSVFDDVARPVLPCTSRRPRAPQSAIVRMECWMTFSKVIGACDGKPNSGFTSAVTPGAVASRSSRSQAPSASQNPPARVIRSSLSRRSSDNCAARSTSSAHLVSHRRDDAQEEQAGRERRVDNLPEHQHDLSCGRQDEEHDGCRPATAPAAGRRAARR